jgi:hypothetical protein
MMVLICTTLFLFATQQVLAEEELISVSVDSLPVIFEVAPITDQGRTLVPFRAIAEALNVTVDWDGTTRSINAGGLGTNVQLQIGSSTASVNGMPVTLDVPPQIINGRTLIPLRFFSEAFNCQVEWVDASREVRIISPPSDLYVTGFYALGDTRTSSWTNLFGVQYPETAPGNTDVVDELAFGWYSMDADGNLLLNSGTGWQRPSGWEAMLEAAHQYDLSTEMVVHLTDGTGAITSILASDQAMGTAVSAIIEEAAMYDGVNLNFEGLGLSESGEALIAVQENFTQFVQLLSSELKSHHKTLTLTVHAPNSAYRGYDYAALGKASDKMIMMAYDYGPKPEPISQVMQAVEMALEHVSSEKLLLGISAPYETAESVVAKMGIAKRYSLKGVALWRLGLVPPDMWDTMRAHTIPE